MPAEASMREVVQRLRAEGSEALLELYEFDQALDEFLRNLEGFEAASRELHAATCNGVGSGNREARASSAVQEHASRLSILAAHFLGAFRQLHGAVHDWNITDPQSRSGRASSGSPSASSEP